MGNYQVFIPKFRVEECLAEIRDCLEKGWSGMGYKTVELEKQWKGYTGLPNAHYLNSATAGLHLAVAILKKRFGWNEGDEIITTPFTFVSTNHAILYERLSPVFADIDESLNLNPESVRSKIGARTRAIMFVGIGGNAQNLQEIRQIAADHRLKLILDAAHMSGTRIDGRHIGREADVSVFSFQAVKNLPTADSGMICFMDDELDNLARKMTWLGIDKDTFSRRTNEGKYKWRYTVDEVGFKYHGNSIVASLALVGLKYLDEDNEYRRLLAGRYEKELAGEPLVEVIRHTGCESSRHLCQIAVTNRDRVVEALNGAGIFPGVHYIDNTNYLPYVYARGTCPKSAHYSERVISLPMHLGIRLEDAAAIAATLRKILAA